MAYGYPKNFNGGDLRYLVWIGERVQTAQSTGTGIDETIGPNGIDVYASITPVGNITWLSGVVDFNAANIQSAFTHEIIIRWLPGWNYLNNVVVRQLLLPDDSTATEVFRIISTADVDGRQRFTKLRCVLESAQ